MSESESQPGVECPFWGVALIIGVIIFLGWYGLDIYDSQPMDGDVILRCEQRTREYPELRESLIKKLEDGKLTRREDREFLFEYAAAVAKDTHDRLAWKPNLGGKKADK